MGKRKEITEKMAFVEKRYGKTLGASKGTRPAPKVDIKVRPTGGIKALQGKGGVKVKIEKKF